jgi:hypothetical protein
MPAEIADFTISRLEGPRRLPEILAVVHASFAGLTPPSGALSEALDDVAARLRAGSILIAQAGGAVIGSVFAVRKDDALYLTRMARCRPGAGAGWRARC